MLCDNEYSIMAAWILALLLGGALTLPEHRLGDKGRFRQGGGETLPANYLEREMFQ